MTPKREAFAAALARGLTKAAAYREAFPASLKWQDATVWRRASEMSSDRDVQGRVEDLQLKAAAANEVTMAQHIATLEELREEARAEKQFGPAIKAEELRGKASGLYIERLQHSNPDGTLRPQVIKIIAA